MLTVVGIILVLAALVMAGLHVGARKVHGASCLNNLKQLQVSWQLYADDFQDRVPLNQSYQVMGIWRSTPDSWIGNSSAPHDRDTLAIQNGLMFKYDYQRALSTYRCPADDAVVFATDLPRTRSYSMNGAFGGNVDPGKPLETEANISQVGQVQYPSQTFVLIDEHEDSIDDAHFKVWFQPDPRWVNMPSDRHGKAAAASFVDGHTELLRWNWPKSFADKRDFFKAAVNEHDLKDLRKLQRLAYPWLDPK